MIAFRDYYVCATVYPTRGQLSKNILRIFFRDCMPIHVNHENNYFATAISSYTVTIDVSLSVIAAAHSKTTSGIETSFESPDSITRNWKRCGTNWAPPSTLPDSINDTCLLTDSMNILLQSSIR